jgi:hypothetical protein
MIVEVSVILLTMNPVEQSLNSSLSITPSFVGVLPSRKRKFTQMTIPPSSLISSVTLGACYFSSRTGRMTLRIDKRT